MTTKTREQKVDELIAELRDNDIHVSSDEDDEEIVIHLSRMLSRGRQQLGTVSIDLDDDTDDDECYECCLTRRRAFISAIVKTTLD